MAAKKKSGSSKSKKSKSPPKMGDDEAVKRFKSIHKVGLEIKAQQERIAKQERKTELAHAEHKGEKDNLAEMNRVLREMQEELNTLAAGGEPETLFPASGIPAKTPADGPSNDEAVFLSSTLKDIGIPSALIGKLESDGIKTGKDLRDWQGQQNPRKVQGIAESGEEKIRAAMSSWYENRLNARKAQGKTGVGEPNDSVPKTESSSELSANVA